MDKILTIAAIETRLESDPVPNLMALKFLRMFEDQSQYELLVDGQEWVSSVSYPPNLFYYDQEKYSACRRVWYVNGNSPRLLDQLFAQRDLDLQVFKTSSQPSSDWFAARLPAARRFYWYSADHAVPPHPGAQMGDTYDEQIDELLQANGVVDEYRARMRASDHQYVWFQDGKHIVSFCYLQQNWRHIWEISGVFTRPEYRGQGLGKVVVATAQNWLQARRLTSRYYVESSNHASIALARSVGLRPIVESVHFLGGAGGVAGSGPVPG